VRQVCRQSESYVLLVLMDVACSSSSHFSGHPRPKLKDTICRCLCYVQCTALDKSSGGGMDIIKWAVT
jgi:hypothetical protein